MFSGSLFHLHSHDEGHGVQVDRRGFIAKVSDFGLSQLQPDKSPHHGSPSAAVEAAGTVTHMAPEMLEHGVGSCASDVYSFAILGD